METKWKLIIDFSLYQNNEANFEIYVIVKVLKYFGNTILVQFIKTFYTYVKINKYLHTNPKTQRIEKNKYVKLFYRKQSNSSNHVVISIRNLENQN